ncbi:MAG: hypothetical protein PHI34_04800 [Acidobacteriota bacterium]|nr:hypothetical protein [Acidobacteriota bacterium]
MKKFGFGPPRAPIRSAAELPAGLAATLARQWVEAAEHAASAKDGLTAFLRIHFDFLASAPETGEILYQGPPDDQSGRFDASVRDLFKPLLEAVAAQVERGKRDKAFRPDVDPASAAVHFLGLVQMAFQFWSMKGRSGSLRGIGEELFGQWLNSISA